VENASLAELCTLGVGGPAAYLATAESEADVLRIVQWARQRGLPLWVLGGGSNVVVSDSGLDGVVLRIALRGTRWFSRTGIVEASAGESWDDLVREAVDRGWAGVECLSGIPGSVGATPVQNVGAYGQEVSQTIASVRIYDRVEGRVTRLSREGCRFGYRHSIFKSSQDRYVVLSVGFRLRPGEPPTPTYTSLAERLETVEHPTLEHVRTGVLEMRRAKSMLYDPQNPEGGTCGSFFLNPIVDATRLQSVRKTVGDTEVPYWPQRSGMVKLAAAWLIEKSGFPRGSQDGGVGLSAHHALAIVCRGDARATDVVRFATRLQAAVHQRFGISLEPEPAFWGWSAFERLPASLRLEGR
jgi:UDP-N-acetylmuramate dehydrogenase